MVLVRKAKAQWQLQLHLEWRSEQGKQSRVFVTVTMTTGHGVHGAEQGLTKWADKGKLMEVFLTSKPYCTVGSGIKLPPFGQEELVRLVFCVKCARVWLPETGSSSP